MKKALCIALVLLAPACCVYGQMKLLSPGVGWVAYGGTIFFTKDNGTHWNDITPHAPGIPKAATIGALFFRNGSEGWAVESYPERTAPTLEAMLNAKTVYAVLHTKDSGESWSSWPLTYPAQPKWIEETFAGPASLFFLDSTHGWMDVAYSGMSHPGKLLATDDGGHTWRWVGSPIHSGPIYFHSLNDGWLISNDGARELYVTHDRAKSWQQVHPKLPPKLGQSIYPMFLEMPTFIDSQHGYLGVHYSGRGGSSLKLVVYATNSGGNSWKPVKVLPGSGYTPVALAGPVVILPCAAGKGKPSTESVPIATPAQPTRPVSSETRYAILAFSFVDENHGWALKGDGLYSTDDGGATWTKITPPAASPRSYGRTVVVHAPPPQIRGHR